MSATHIHWLASYPKSGNTWVRAFLEHYDTGKLDINNMEVVLGDERVYYYQVVSAQPYHTFDLYQWAMVRPAALNMYLHMYPRRDKLILKTHNAHAIVADIPLFPPLISGPSVYLIRNPIDVIPSFARHTDRSIDQMIELAADNRHAFKGDVEKNTMIGFLSSWASHVKTWSVTPDTLVVRYEDLITNPDYWFSKILEQFEYDVNKSRVRKAIEACEIEKLREQEQAAGFVEVGKSEHFFGGTKQKLTPSQISRVIENFEPIMREHGYLNEEIHYGCNH